MEPSKDVPHPRAGFWWARIGSLLSVVPLGIWVSVHLWKNLHAFHGADSWELAVTHYSHPFMRIGTWVIVFLPLALHAVWGTQRILTSRPNNLRYRYFENLKYALHRIAAVGVLLFIGAHVWLAFLEPRLVFHHPETFRDISQNMRYHWPTFLVYLLGTFGVAYHLGNGLFGFAWTWGLAKGRRSFQTWNVIAVSTFLVLWLMSWLVVFALFSAGAHYGPPSHFR